MQNWRNGAVLAGALALTACGTTTETADAASETYVGCAGDKRVNLGGFPANAASEDGAFVLHFTTGQPALPLAGENTWTFAVQTPDGAKADFTSIAGVAFMPDHGHPSSVAPQASLQPDGTWKVQNLVLSMAGVWRVTFTLKRASGTDVTVVVFTCVAG